MTGKTEIKATCKKFNGQYKIIILTRNGINEFYLEKIGYGNLHFIVGAKVDELNELERDYILQAIAIAEYNQFWQD